MKETLKPGLTFEYAYTVPPERTVPHLMPEMEEGRVMPDVLASGYMIGLFEFVCIKALADHLEWPAEQTVGIGFNLNHTAPTPPGYTVTVKVELTEVAGKKLTFAITAHDGADTISTGTHERFVIQAEKFKAAVAAKAGKLGR